MIPAPLETPSGRLAYRFLPSVVRALIPSDTIGSYVLLAERQPIYVGRSDTCLQARLADHPLLRAATHFVWEVCGSPAHAYHIETGWFHKLIAVPHCLNLIHPARPAGSDALCLVCSPPIRKALARVFASRRSA